MILATSDIHSPVYLREFLIELNKYKGKTDIDLFLLAGDLVEKGNYRMFKPVYDSLRGIRTVAVFGNEDYQEYRNSYKHEYPDITWLDDNYTELDYKGKKLVIIGSDGVLERPTTWQKMNGMDENYYRRKLETINDLLCNTKADYKILLTHYLPTFETAFGEKKSVYPQLGYKILEEAKCLPNVAVHGHAHLSKVTFKIVRGVRVYNVAFPANRHFVRIPLDPLLGI